MRNPLRRTMPVFLLLLILLSACIVPALAGDDLLVNGGFSGDALPDGWNVTAYRDDGFEIVRDSDAVYISAVLLNDVRLSQKITVEPSSVYVFTADVSCGNVAEGKGACLSIDNYSIDGSYIYSSSMYGTNGWQSVTLAFRTGPEQTVINAALRLGGYSEMSSGTAGFRSPHLERASANVPNVIALQTASAAKGSGSVSPDPESRQIQLRSYLNLFVLLTLTVCLVLSFGVYRNRTRICSREASADSCRRVFALVVLIGLSVHSITAYVWGGHDTDMNCWIGWGNYIAQSGPSTFYTAPGHEWYDYPPAYMLVLGAIARFLQLLQVPASSPSVPFFYMLPAYAADVGCAALLMRSAGEKGRSGSEQLLLSTLVIFSPAVFMLSGVWGQIDSILTFFLLLSFLLLLKDRPVASGAIYGLAIMIKWQALICGPVLAVMFLLRTRSVKAVLRTVLSVIAAFVVIILVSLPFRGLQAPLWIVHRFLSASSGYDYASIEAYNFMALAGGNWAPSSDTLFYGLTYKAFGTISIAVSVLVSCIGLVWYSAAVKKKPESMPTEAAFFLAVSYCMFSVYTFGHYMHERYVFPAILYLMFTYVYSDESRFLHISLLLSSVLFLNEMTAMFVVSNTAMSAVRSSREHLSVVTVCSYAEVITFLYFLKVCIDRLLAFLRIGGAK